MSNYASSIGIIGLGYVGLPLVIGFATRGSDVHGFDIDPRKIELLNLGKSYIKHIPEESIRSITQAGKFKATTDFAELKDVKTIIICVPTPLTEKMEPDLTFIVQTGESIFPHLQRGQLVVLESTTYPGTTEELLVPILEKSGLTAGRDFYVGFSPEREDPGNKQFKTHQIPKVVSGINEDSRILVREVYEKMFEKVVVVSSPRVAEMSKLLENIYRCVNIALVNELKLLCQRMDIDLWEVISAASTKPFGFTPFYPGPGLGGHCIPIDPFYLSWKAKEYDFPTRFIELAGEINTAMPFHVVESVTEALNRNRQSVNGSRILVLGVSYKRDIDDLRESPSLKIIQLLQDRGAQVDYNDPYFPTLHKMRKYDFKLKSVDLTHENLASYDCVVIATDHSSYDYPAIVASARRIVDTRNATAGVHGREPKVVLA
ncbi:MAG: nucleotide sugar dehydrogenase [Acidobacteriia bacterium]|nr:nucleotide sugar dehydrogenase [Terriglobia bacterium]